MSERKYLFEALLRDIYKIGGDVNMEKRVALLSIIVDERDSVEKLNALLHE